MEAYLDILIHPWALWTALMATVLIICFCALSAAEEIASSHISFRVWFLAVLVALSTIILVVSTKGDYWASQIVGSVVGSGGAGVAWKATRWFVREVERAGPLSGTTRLQPDVESKKEPTQGELLAIFQDGLQKMGLAEVQKKEKLIYHLVEARALGCEGLHFHGMRLDAPMSAPAIKMSIKSRLEELEGGSKPSVWDVLTHED